MKDKLTSMAERINARLDGLMGVYTSDNAKGQLICAEAMRYSLSAGGKRIRPVLVLEFARIFGNAEDKALDTACALEMIHTFSLIHDDLPCMDDDDTRRGRPSCHKAFGEDVALLAGDALENYAFDVIVSDGKLSYEQRVRLVKALSHAVGLMGMTGGQVIDVINCGKPFEGDTLLDMYRMKTGALLRCACEMGCICAERYDMVPEAVRYAEALGLAFQIVDDILDITADEKLLGKPVNSDAELGKATYPAVFGLDAARAEAQRLTAEAVAIANTFPDSGFLVQLTEYLLERDH